MTGRLLSEAAASVDAPPSLVPVLDELFAGIDALGSSPRLVVAMLREAGVGAGDMVLDLGCGKGAAMVAAAAMLKCRCVGVEAVPAFVKAAQVLATRRRVAGRCVFEIGDVRRFAAARRFDAAIMLGVFDVVRASALLRRHVRPGGVMVIDDAVVVSRGRVRRRWLTLEGARAALRRRGDELIREDVWTPSRVATQEAMLYSRLSCNAERLMIARPSLARSLRAFLRRQREASAMLRGPIRPVQWMVRVA